MDRATLDASLDHSSSRKTVEARKEVGGAKIELDEQQFRDLISVHLGDWLQQVTITPLDLIYYYTIRGICIRKPSLLSWKEFKDKKV